MLNVAVVGSGPAGLYAAEALVKQAAALPVPVPVRVDVIDRLPTPYGLVRGEKIQPHGNGEGSSRGGTGNGDGNGNNGD